MRLRFSLLVLGLAVGSATASDPFLPPGGEGWASGLMLTQQPDPVPVMPAYTPEQLTGPAVSTLTGQPAAHEGGEGGGASGGNGTNPAENVTTFIVSNEFYQLNGGNQINTTYTRFKFPVYDGRGSLLLEIPYVYYNLRSTFPNAPEIGGLGDVKIQGSFNTWTSESKKFTVINFVEAFLPTADNTLVNRPLNPGTLAAFNLGTGKYVLGAGMGVVYAISPTTIIAPLYFFEGSAFGNRDRAVIRRGKFRLFAMKAWKNGVYVLPEFQALTNYLNGGTDFYMAPELGLSRKGTTAYVKPGFGIDDGPGERQWGLEFGFRVQF